MLERKERRDYQENRRIILRSAQELFDVHGVDNVSMRQIAQLAGVGQGTLYRRYAHKGELCLDIMKDRMDCIGEEVQSYLYESKDQTIHQRLIKIIEIILEFVELQSQNLSAIKAPNHEHNSIIYSTPIYKSIHAIICELLKEAILVQGHSKLNPAYTADAILAMLSPELYVYQRKERGYSMSEIKANISSLFFDPLFATIQS